MEERVNRRASSPKRDTDILKTDWPATSHALYVKALGKPDGLPPKLRTLCLAKIRMEHAMLAMDKALSEYHPQSYKPEQPDRESDRKVYNKLRGIRDKVEKLRAEFPLQIL